jgi:hypothetical protein
MYNKQYIFVTIIITLFVFNACNDPVDQQNVESNGDNLLPLHVGNEYLYYNEIRNGYSLGDWYSLKSIVEKETVNRKDYYKFKNGEIWRSDDDKVYYYVKDYDIEYLIYDYSVNVGDTVTFGSWIFIVESIISDTLFDDLSSQKIITCSNTRLNPETYVVMIYATKYGALYREEYDHNDTTFTTLIGGKINGDLFGETSSE